MCASPPVSEGVARPEIKRGPDNGHKSAAFFLTCRERGSTRKRLATPSGNCCYLAVINKTTIDTSSLPISSSSPPMPIPDNLLKSQTERDEIFKWPAATEVNPQKKRIKGPKHKSMEIQRPLPTERRRHTKRPMTTRAAAPAACTAFLCSAACS